MKKKKYYTCGIKNCEQENVSFLNTCTSTNFKNVLKHRSREVLLSERLISIGNKGVRTTKAKFHLYWKFFFYTAIQSKVRTLVAVRVYNVIVVNRHM